MINVLDDIVAHAVEELPRECCGVVIVFKGKHKYIPCINDSNGNDEFSMNPKSFADAEDLGEIVYIVHSHPYTTNQPSMQDLVNIERSNVPWLIINPHTKEYSITNPSGYIAPLIGRQFHHGVLDCYTLIRDYYKQELNIEIPDYPREEHWWLLGYNLYVDNFESANFELVTDGTLKAHDVVLMQVNSPAVNHGGVITAEGYLLQHVMGRLSSRDVYSGYYRNITTHVVRHKELK
jgi:proteasome lid subunit RPN8/RPN11